MNKSIFSLSVLGLVLSANAFAKDFILTDAEHNVEIANWKVSSVELGIAGAPAFAVEKKTLHGGKQEGSTTITVDTGELQVTLIPTRGLNIYEIKSDGIRYGWKSPVDEIVNPAFVNLEMRNGLGWLDGFNEMMVRCGFEWTGHPGQEKGRLLSLHGRAGNTPASKLVVSIDETPPYAIHVKGLIKENTFKFNSLETWASLTATPGSKTVKVHDELTNTSDYDRDYQIIYHSNFGQPILEEGAKFSAAVKEVSPFNDYAIKGLKDWQTYLGPTRGYDEMVFNLVPVADKEGRTVAMLQNKAGDRGIAVGFNTNQLPVLTLWKNTDSVRQGYVTGIEPGTSYAYPRQIERQQGRIKSLAPDGKQAFDVEYRVLSNADDVQAVQSEISALTGDSKIKLVDEPIAKE